MRGAVRSTLAAVVLLAAHPARASSPAAFELKVGAEGVYRVFYEDLRAAGLPDLEIASADLALSLRGRPQPLWVEDGGDGRFGPGDHLELIGHQLHGDRTFHHPYADCNVYRLELGRGPGPRFTGPAVDQTASGGSLASVAQPAVLEVHRHLEEDRLRRFIAQAADGQPEHWYWAGLSHVEPAPFRLDLELDDDREGPLAITVELQGLSSPDLVISRHAPGATTMPDHRVDVFLNQALIGSGEWEGQARGRIEVPAVPAAQLRRGANELAMWVPRRWVEEGADPIVDLVLLDWIELRYRSRGRVGERQARYEVDAGGGRRVSLTTPRDVRLWVFTDTGLRLGPGQMEADDTGDEVHYSLMVPADSHVLYAVPDAWLAPEAIEPVRPSRLRDPSQQADYLIIAYPDLMAAIEPLAAYHREHGLTVRVVDVREVYDTFNDGIVDPRAVRDFIAYAAHAWLPPAPRFVLLVGDASWAGRGLPVRGAEASDDGDVEHEGGWHRNLIPTWLARSFGYFAASDNGFVTLDDGDDLPDLAIGRIPVTEPDEVAAVVAKTLHYARDATPGPWQREVVMVVSQDRRHKAANAELIQVVTRLGFDARELQPDAAGDLDAEQLVQAFDRGPLLLHFIGHGARTVWRTGPSEWRKKTDFFTIDDLDRLQPSTNLPLVLSITCSTAGFDSPSEDSLGEKLLRLAGRGAVAVLAASWLNSPNPAVSTALFEELARPDATIGEAILRAKRRVDDPVFVATYNLLGDPALELHLPPLQGTPGSGPEDRTRDHR